MEIKFQKPNFLVPKSKPSRTKSCKKNKFLGVRQRPSGKWVAEIKNTTQKIRMWLGTFDTAEEAAKAYDEAACLLRGSNTRKNFVDHCAPDSHISMKIRSLFNQKKALKQNLTFIPTNSSTKTTMKINSQTTNHVLPIGFNQGFNLIHEELPNYNFSFQTAKPMIEASTTMSNQTNSPQSYSGNTSPSTSGYPNQDFHIFDDDAYKPDLSHCFKREENSMGPFQFEQAFGNEFYQLLSTKEEFLVPKSENRLPEFEHMKVERQISASLYAINGINEYWENFNNFSDSLLDLTIVSQMFCPN